MAEHIQVVTTTETQEDARRIARALVEARLASCVQIIGPIESTYHWKGAIETNREWQCMIKTRLDRFTQVDATIRRLHPYEVPEVFALPMVAGSRDYLKWIDAEVSSRSSGSVDPGEQ